jgi:hypothetical protein
MKKSKFLEDDLSKQYKKQLAEFMQQINPKPTLEQLEQLRQKYLQARESHENKVTL